MKRIASLHLLQSGELEFDWDYNKPENYMLRPSQCERIDRLSAISKLWNDSRLIALLDQFIQADKGGM